MDDLRRPPKRSELVAVASGFAVLGVVVGMLAVHLWNLEGGDPVGALATAVLASVLLAISGAIAFAKPRGATPAASRRAGQAMWVIGAVGVAAALIIPGQVHYRLMLLGPSLSFIAWGLVERNRR